MASAERALGELDVVGVAGPDRPVADVAAADVLDQQGARAVVEVDPPDEVGEVDVADRDRARDVADGDADAGRVTDPGSANGHVLDEDRAAAVLDDRAARWTRQERGRRRDRSRRRRWDRSRFRVDDDRVAGPDVVGRHQRHSCG
jgi:hypothetical protein